MGLHSLLFQTKVKAAAAIMSYNLALTASDSLRSPTGSAGQAAQQLSYVLHGLLIIGVLFSCMIAIQ